VNHDALFENKNRYEPLIRLLQIGCRPLFRFEQLISAVLIAFHL